MLIDTCRIAYVRLQVVVCSGWIESHVGLEKEEFIALTRARIVPERCGHQAGRNMSQSRQKPVGDQATACFSAHSSGAVLEDDRTRTWRSQHRTSPVLSWWVVGLVAMDVCALGLARLDVVTRQQ